MTQSLGRKITPGIYLIIDPSMDELLLLKKLTLCLREGVAAVQIWDNFNEGQNIIEFIRKVCELSHAENTPVLINNKWELISKTALDGVHFDEIPDNYPEVVKSTIHPYIIGLTCNNDLTLVSWANKNKLDYVSFCSMFPSDTANSCEIVRFDTVQQASEHYSIPIFLAGGIKPENMDQIEKLDYNGIAIVSGIMSAEKPNESIKKYQDKLNKK